MRNYSRAWANNLDSKGLCVQSISKDPGDSPVNTGVSWLGCYLADSFVGLGHPVKCLEEYRCLHNEGRYRRYWQATKWGKCDKLTRDQATGIALLMLVASLYKKPDLKIGKFLWQLFWPAKEQFNGRLINYLIPFFRTFNFTNWREPLGSPREGKSTPDITGFMLISILLRAHSKWWWPVYALLDVEIFLAAIFDRVWPPKRDDVHNHMARVLVASRIYPTPFGLLAEKLTDWKRIHAKLTINFDRSLDGDQGPPIHELITLKLLENK